MMMKATGKVRRTGIPTTTTVSKGTERGPGARPICLQGPGTRYLGQAGISHPIMHLGDPGP
jgi:hypothetical protein